MERVFSFGDGGNSTTTAEAEASPALSAAAAAEKQHQKQQQQQHLKRDPWLAGSGTPPREPCKKRKTGKEKEIGFKKKDKQKTNSLLLHFPPTTATALSAAVAPTVVATTATKNTRHEAANNPATCHLLNQGSIFLET